MVDLLILELVSLVKWVAIGYLLIRMAAYFYEGVCERANVRRTKSLSVLAKASGEVFDSKLKSFVDYLIKEIERSPR